VSDTFAIMMKLRHGNEALRSCHASFSSDRFGRGAAHSDWLGCRLELLTKTAIDYNWLKQLKNWPLS